QLGDKPFPETSLARPATEWLCIDIETHEDDTAQAARALHQYRPFERVGGLGLFTHDHMEVAARLKPGHLDAGEWIALEQVGRSPLGHLAHRLAHRPRPDRAVDQGLAIDLWQRHLLEHG